MISQRIYNGVKLLIAGIIFGLLLAYMSKAFAVWGGDTSTISLVLFFGLSGFLVGFVFNK